MALKNAGCRPHCFPTFAPTLSADYIDNIHAHMPTIDRNKRGGLYVYPTFYRTCFCVDISDERFGTKEYIVDFNNKCSSSIDVAIHYYNSDGEWETLGWYKDNPPGLGGQYFRTSASVFYYHAKDSGRHWGGTDLYRSVDGSDYEYGFKKVEIDLASDTGTFIKSLTCTDSYSKDPWYEFRFTTNCRNPPHVLIYYKDTEHGWQSRGWWKIPYWKIKYILKTQSDYFYFHAETENTKFQGDHTFDHKGRTYKFYKAASGDVITLNCT